MYLWWSLCSLYLLVFICMPGESYCRWLGSLLCVYDIFGSLINSLICWFYTVFRQEHEAFCQPLGWHFCFSCNITVNTSSFHSKWHHKHMENSAFRGSGNEGHFRMWLSLCSDGYRACPGATNCSTPATGSCSTVMFQTSKCIYLHPCGCTDRDMSCILSGRFWTELFKCMPKYHLPHR